MYKDLNKCTYNEAASVRTLYKFLHRLPSNYRYSQSVSEQIKDTYQAKDCTGCFLNGVSLNNQLLKHKADKRLKSKRGIEKRKQRCFDVEPVFASIKHNHNFRCFMLRGKEKVAVETGLLTRTQLKKEGGLKKPTTISSFPKKLLPITPFLTDSHFNSITRYTSP